MKDLRHWWPRYEAYSDGIDLCWASDVETAVNGAFLTFYSGLALKNNQIVFYCSTVLTN
jgi:hypothetical protein